MGDNNTMETEDVEEIPEFDEIWDKGEFIEKTGYHSHEKDKFERHKKRSQRCDCYIPVTSSGGSYTRIKKKVGDKEILYWHQKPVYMKYDDRTLVIAEPYYKKKKVKEKIEEVLPKGYELKQLYGHTNAQPKRRTWYITEPKYDNSKYYKEEGSEKLDKRIKIPREEQIVKNL